MTTHIKLTFKDKKGYNKAKKLLTSNGYKDPTCRNAGKGYFNSCDYTLIIKFKKELSSEILTIMADNQDCTFNIEFVKPQSHVIINHGGYLD